MLMTLMLPVQVQVIPEYILFTKLGLLNTFWPLLLPRIGGRGVFHLPDHAVHSRHPARARRAAAIDGCGEFGDLLPHHRAAREAGPR